jgi:glyoxylase-like metal-dependent hydrolase (beta-lactamase superfamily II)
MNEVADRNFAGLALEDEWLDIVEKVRQGRGVDQFSICSMAGIEPRQWRDFRSGALDEGILVDVARALGLGVRGIIKIARGGYVPEVPEVPGLVRIKTPFPATGFARGVSNVFLVRDPQGGPSALFDAGTVSHLVMEHLQKEDAEIGHIFLTHGHSDHVAALPTLHAAYPDAPIRSHESERLSECMGTIADGEIVECGALRIEAIHTPGHTPGCMSYLVTGLALPIVFVGDSLFAGSIGRATGSWDQAVESVRRRILSLPPQTVICPGHGALTTVAYEVANNPLFQQTGKADRE